MCLGTFLRLRRSLFYNLLRRLLRRTFALQMYDNACDIYIVRRSAHPRGAFLCNGNEVSYYRDEIRSANLALISGRQMHRINACIFLVAITKKGNGSIKSIAFKACLVFINRMIIHGRGIRLYVYQS